MPYDLTEMKQTLDLVPPFNPSKQSGVIQFATQPEENEEDNFGSSNGGGFDDNDNEAASHAASLKSRAKKEKKKAIERIFQNYRGSEEEKKDVIKYYKRFAGDFNKIAQSVLLGAHKEKVRWVKDIIKPTIDKGELDNYLVITKKSLEMDCLFLEVDDCDCASKEDCEM